MLHHELDEQDFIWSSETQRPGILYGQVSISKINVSLVVPNFNHTPSKWKEEKDSQAA